MRTIAALFSLMLLSGCHCFGVSEVYNDAIDDVSDHCANKPRFDCWYCEKLDLTRYCMNGSCCRTHCPGTYPRHRPR